jgi:hypothetical protein
LEQPDELYPQQVCCPLLVMVTPTALPNLVGLANWSMLDTAACKSHLCYTGQMHGYAHISVYVFWQNPTVLWLLISPTPMSALFCPCCW